MHPRSGKSRPLAHQCSARGLTRTRADSSPTPPSKSGLTSSKDSKRCSPGTAAASKEMRTSTSSRSESAKLISDDSGRTGALQRRETRTLRFKGPLMWTGRPRRLLANRPRRQRALSTTEVVCLEVPDPPPQRRRQ